MKNTIVRIIAQVVVIDQISYLITNDGRTFRFSDLGTEIVISPIESEDIDKLALYLLESKPTLDEKKK